ncbi:MAG: hypothetical protein O6746_00180 [Thaumarchaeota archaeon]|nr:hypothetical protein [Nitrososphaerota archaeon]
MRIITLSACLLVTIIILVSTTSSIAESLDFENCQGFLSDTEIKNTIDYNGDLELSFTVTMRDDMNIRNMCTLTASTPDNSASISMELISFSGSSPALKHYSKVLDETKNLNVEIYEGKNPWKFFSVELNQGGIGKTVVSQRDVYFLRFYTEETKPLESLATEESLQSLSLVVQQKIVPFAPGSYTPPILPKVETKPQGIDEFAPIPEWIKNNALWWSDGLIADKEFFSAIEYLIDQKILMVPIPASTNEPALPFLPNWIKDTVEWWATGKVTDKDFVLGIQYLIEHGIIRIN